MRGARDRRRRTMRCWRRRPDGAGGFFSRLKEGLSRSTQKLTEGITAVFQQAPAGRRGAGGTGGAADLRRSRHRGGAAGDRRLPPHPLRQGGHRRGDQAGAGRGDRRDPGAGGAAAASSIRRSKPHVVLVVGVNGTGKTTTIGKLAQQYRDAGQARRCWWPATRSAPRRWSSCRSGASASALR